MNRDKFFLTQLTADEYRNIADNDADRENSCSFSRTNVWNNSFSSPEISCDFELLHQDLQEIKTLINDVKDCLKDFICHNEK